MGNIGHTIATQTKDMRRRLTLAGEIVSSVAELDADAVAYFLKNRSQIPEAVKRGFVIPAEPTEKFILLKDLGVITVPDDYDHATALKTFVKKNHKKFYYYNDAITDQNFPNPTRVLKPGDKLRVRAFKQVVPDTTTSEERMAFLATQKAVHTGAQGAVLVFEQKRDQLPKGKWYASFDERDRLWVDAGGNRRVPVVRCNSDGGFYWNLGNFEEVWHDDYVFLCFCDVE